MNKANLAGATAQSPSDGLTAIIDAENEIVTIYGTYTGSSTSTSFRLFNAPNIPTNLHYKPYEITSGDHFAYNGVRLSEGHTFAVDLKNLVPNTAINIQFHMVAYEGDTAPTSWTPYSNICPISGWTGAEIEQTGVNVWDEEWEIGGYEDDGSKNTRTDRIRCKNFISVKPSTTYYIKASSAVQNLIYYTASKEVIGIDGNSNFYNKTFTTPDNCYYIAFNMYSSYGTTYNHDISINYPATDTEYHPYTGNQISVTFPTTIYGGEDEVISGKLKSTMGIVDLGTLNWTYASSGERSLFTSYDLANRYKPSGGSSIPVNAMFECYLNVAMNSTFKNGEAGLDGNISSRIVVCDNRYTDADSFKTAMSGVQLCYELAKPVEYTLAENEMIALDGTNVIWANTGDVAVTYIAKSAKFSFDSPLHIYNYNNLKLFGNTYIEHGKG